MIQHNCALVNLRFRKGDGGRGPKISEDLVQRGRKNKGLRGFVHQVCGGRPLPNTVGRAHRKAPKTWCKGDGRTRACGDTCTKSAAAAHRKAPKTWCKGNGRIRFCGDSCTKSAAAAHRKAPETWCKGDGRTRGCGDSCTKSAAAARPCPGRSHPAPPKKGNKKWNDGETSPSFRRT